MQRHIEQIYLTSKSRKFIEVDRASKASHVYESIGIYDLGVVNTSMVVHHDQDEQYGYFPL